jgi:trypsin
MVGLSMVMLVLAVAPTAATGKDDRIVGGAPTTISEYPWQVALAFNDDLFPGNGFQRQFCGGTLVAPTIVVTAAHCPFDLLPPDGGGFDAAENVEVFTGRTTLSSAEGEAIDVAELYYFQGTASAPVTQAQSTDPDPATGQLYDPETAEWDVAFLRLETPSSVGTPIQIAGPDETATWAPGEPAQISGWGDLANAAGDFPDQLHAATIGMLDDATCARKGVYGPDDFLTFYPETQVCAGIFPAGGIDTCQGDSGGPLVVSVFERGRDSRAVNDHRLVGDTSFGLGCALRGYPGIYGRVAADPLRSALQNGIQQIAGVDVVGSGALPAEDDPPQTKITKHPPKKGDKRKAKFRFTADEEASFECKLDKQQFKPCASPYKKKVGRKGHKFQVRAIDIQGNVDPSADKFKWKVKKG